MSPHGVFQVPKSACSLSDAAASDCEQLLAGAAAMYLPQPCRLPARPPRGDAISSPQKTASDVGTRIHGPAQIPLAQQRDLLGQFRLQRIAGGSRVPRLEQRRDRLLEPRQIAVVRRGDQRIEREILLVLQHPDRRAARAPIRRRSPRRPDNLPASGCSAPAADHGQLLSCRASRSSGFSRCGVSSTDSSPCHSVAGLLPSTGLVQSNSVSRRGMKLPWK